MCVSLFERMLILKYCYDSEHFYDGSIAHSFTLTHTVTTVSNITVLFNNFIFGFISTTTVFIHNVWLKTVLLLKNAVAYLPA